jgi:hypothetical protein
VVGFFDRARQIDAMACPLQAAPYGLAQHVVVFNQKDSHDGQGESNA